MLNQKVQIKDLLFKTDEVLSKNALGDDVFNECFFADWDCHEKTLRKKALDMKKRLDFLDMEVLINHDDYVHFENETVNGKVNNRFIISKKSGHDFTTIGGLQTSHDKKSIVYCGYWRGEYKGDETEIKKYKTWLQLKTKLLQCMKARRDMRKIFFYR